MKFDGVYMKDLDKKYYEVDFTPLAWAVLVCSALAFISLFFTSFTLEYSGIIFNINVLDAISNTSSPINTEPLSILRTTLVVGLILSILNICLSFYQMTHNNPRFMRVINTLRLMITVGLITVLTVIGTSYSEGQVSMSDLGVSGLSFSLYFYIIAYFINLYYGYKQSVKVVNYKALSSVIMICGFFLWAISFIDVGSGRIIGFDSLIFSLEDFANDNLAAILGDDNYLYMILSSTFFYMYLYNAVTNIFNVLSVRNFRLSSVMRYVLGFAYSVGFLLYLIIGLGSTPEGSIGVILISAVYFALLIYTLTMYRNLEGRIIYDKNLRPIDTEEVEEDEDIYFDDTDNPIFSNHKDDTEVIASVNQEDEDEDENDIKDSFPEQKSNNGLVPMDSPVEDKPEEYDSIIDKLIEKYVIDRKNADIATFSTTPAEEEIEEEEIEEEIEEILENDDIDEAPKDIEDTNASELAQDSINELGELQSRSQVTKNITKQDPEAEIINETTADGVALTDEYYKRFTSANTAITSHIINTNEDVLKVESEALISYDTADFAYLESYKAHVATQENSIEVRAELMHKLKAVGLANMPKDSSTNSISEQESQETDIMEEVEYTNDIKELEQEEKHEIIKEQKVIEKEEIIVTVPVAEKVAETPVKVPEYTAYDLYYRDSETNAEFLYLGNSLPTEIKKIKSDQLYSELNEMERIEFRNLFIDLHRTAVPRLPQYYINGDNTAFYLQVLHCLSYVGDISITLTMKIHDSICQVYADDIYFINNCKRKIIDILYPKAKRENGLLQIIEDLCEESVKLTLRNSFGMTIPVINRLAVVYLRQGRFDDAIKMCDFCIRNNIKIDRVGGYEFFKKSIGRLKKAQGDE